MYDVLGRRILKDSNGVVRKYVYDNEDILLEFDNNDSLQAKFTHGPGIDEPLEMLRGSQKYFYHTDGLGSIASLTDASGSTVQSYSYSSFGETKVFNGTGIEISPSSMIQSPYGYTAREWDSETSQYYYRARYYDPRTGSFISPDPWDFMAGDTNLYRYVGNKPTRFTDPSGLFCVDRFLDRYEYNVKTTTDATSFANSGTFAVVSDVLQDYGLSGSGRSLNSLFGLIDKLGAREKFNLLNKLGPALAKSFALNIAKGIGAGILLDGALWSGISTGSMIEALIGESFNTDDCEEDSCNVK